jgi:hypothetical protein
MSELVPVPPIVVEVPPAPDAPAASDSSPIPVLAEGTAPVAIRYQPARTPRRVWPYVVAVAVSGAAALGGYTVYAKREARRDLERRYPIAATASEQTQLANGSARWSQGRSRLLASLAAFDAPELATLKGVGACTLSITTGASPSDDRDLDISLRRVILPGESFGDLASIARPEIDHLIAAAERGRFQTIAGRDHVVRSLGGAFVVVRVDERRLPELDRAHDAIAPGVLAGTAYAFDPASGALRCAGAFRATSSESIGSLSGFSGLDRAQDAAIRDFDIQVETSIVSSLRSID